MTPHGGARVEIEISANRSAVPSEPVPHLSKVGLCSVENLRPQSISVTVAQASNI